MRLGQKLVRRFFVAAVCVFAASTSEVSAQGEVLDDKVNWRFQTNQDGSRTEFHRRGVRSRTLVKKQFSKSGVLQMLTVYRLDRRGNPINCDLVDAAGTQLFYVLYGYDGVTGRLAEEQMYDARKKRIDKETGKEKPVMRFIYMTDAAGNNQAPIAMTLIEGKTAEEAFEIGPTQLSAEVLEILREEAEAGNQR